MGDRPRDTPAGHRAGRAAHLARARLLLLCAGFCAGLVLALSHAAAGRVPASDSIPVHGPVRPAASLRRSTPAKGPIPVSVSVDTNEPGRAVPSDFLGLSFELSALSRIATYGGGGDLVTLLRSLGPGVLRFGGVSADEDVGWADGTIKRPAWATSQLEANSLRELGRLALVSGWHVLLTVGLGHFEPLAAASEAAAAKAAIGGGLAGIELGNEPNAYARHGLRPEPWAFVEYDAQITAYRTAIEAVAPGIPLAGPDVSGSGAFNSWGVGEAIAQQPALLTGHHYPLGCAEDPPPSIARLLSPGTRRLEDVSLAHYMSIAEASETPFRLDEANTVSCGGVAGISNTFASTLWAANYIAQAMSMGVAGINLQGNPANCEGYTPLCAPTPEALAKGELAAQPEWYALLLDRALVGDHPLPTTTLPKERPNVESTGFLGAGGALQFVIVDDDPSGSRSVAVRLHVGRGYGGASVMSLTAPSLSSPSGVRLAGRAVAPDGSFTTPPRLPRVPDVRGVITYDIPPASAALLTVPPARAR